MRTADLLRTALRDFDGHQLDASFAHFSDPDLCVHLSLTPTQTKKGYKGEWFLNGKRVARHRLDFILGAHHDDV